MPYMDPKLKIFSCNSNPDLAKEIANVVGVPLGDAEVMNFSDGEIHMRLNESVRGCNVFVIQSTSAPVNDHLMEMLVMVDALKRPQPKVLML